LTELTFEKWDRWQPDDDPACHLTCSGHYKANPLATMRTAKRNKTEAPADLAKINHASANSARRVDAHRLVTMANVIFYTSLNHSRSLLHFALEALACRLPGQGATERAKRRVGTGVVASPLLHTTADTMSPVAFRSWLSLGHDTPAHCGGRWLSFVPVKMGALGAVPMHRRLTGEVPCQRDECRFCGVDGCGALV
jgi:hypothetical protein